MGVSNEMRESVIDKSREIRTHVEDRSAGLAAEREIKRMDIIV